MQRCWHSSSEGTFRAGTQVVCQTSRLCHSPLKLSSTTSSNKATSWQLLQHCGTPNVERERAGGDRSGLSGCAPAQRRPTITTQYKHVTLHLTWQRSVDIAFCWSASDFQWRKRPSLCKSMHTEVTADTTADNRLYPRRCLYCTQFCCC